MVARICILSALSVLLTLSTAQANFTISKEPTHDVSCSAGFCTPTAQNANLNVRKLTKMLASGDATVISGNGDGTTPVIEVVSGFSWTSASRLTLDAKKSIVVDAPVTVAGNGTLTIYYDKDGGSNGDLLFNGKGKIDFWDVSGSLVINGYGYVLLHDVKDMASQISKNEDGLFAFARDYDATADGAYTNFVASLDEGTFEGLGHTISGLRINGTNNSVGFFSSNHGVVRDIRIVDLRISVPSQGGDVGSLIATNYKVIANVFVSGSIDTSTGQGSGTGGLVGTNWTTGTIFQSTAKVRVNSGTPQTWLGGLVGYQLGTIVGSTASGNVTSAGSNYVGGLAGYNDGTIGDSHATGNVFMDVGGNVGGFVGWNKGNISGSLASGSIRSVGDFVGGFAGRNSGTIANSSATGSVSQQSETGILGGLVGINFDDENSGAIDRSYATGNVIIASAGRRGGFGNHELRPRFHCEHIAGALAGDGGTISNSYALGKVNGGTGDCLGGLVGGYTTTKFSYGIGTVTSGGADASVHSGPRIGGYVGNTSNKHVLAQYGYWDTDTSGLAIGCGHGLCAGISGLTDVQLKSGLPNGFDPLIWGSDPNINGGYPYLLANPPPN